MNWAELWFFGLFVCLFVFSLFTFVSYFIIFFFSPSTFSGTHVRTVPAVTSLALRFDRDDRPEIRLCSRLQSKPVSSLVSIICKRSCYKAVFSVLTQRSSQEEERSLLYPILLFFFFSPSTFSGTHVRTVPAVASLALRFDRDDRPEIRLCSRLQSKPVSSLVSIICKRSCYKAVFSVLTQRSSQEEERSLLYPILLFFFFSPSTFSGTHVRTVPAVASLALRFDRDDRPEIRESYVCVHVWRFAV